MISLEGGSLMGSNINSDWLPHLSPEVISETEGNYLDAYVVALEGWRRGLTLKWHVKDSEKFKEMKTWFVDQPGQLFSLHSKETSHYFFRTRGDKVPNEAVEQGMDKEITKQMLTEKGILVPEGKQFSREATEAEMLQYANKIGFPVVVKPSDGSFGRGVLSDIRTEGELQHSIDFLRTEYNPEQIILERYIKGKDYRLYIVGDQVVGAILRVPPNVIGDGINSIDSLIEIKNNERNLNPRLVSCPIKPDQGLIEYIGRSNYKLASIPGEGEVIYLSDISNISIGGDPIDVFEELSDSIKATAVQALQAIPGLVQGAVDLMVHTDDTDKETAYVIELNPTSQLGGILFPIQGKSRDVPAAIIDYYFPETKEIKVEKEKMYFDFYDVLEPLISRQSTISTVSPAPMGNIFMKQYTVLGDVQDFGYHLGLRKQAFERGLHGYVQNVNDDAINIVVGGTDEEMVNDFKNGITEDEERATVLEIQEQPYHGYLKVGFDSRANLNTATQELEAFQEQIDTLSMEVKALEVERRKLQKSMSWRLTYPVRVVGAVKKIFKK